jgi:TetR/AcrR family transcriptional regulator, regulator of cefoperazone and chloramphenicol sensitivity
MRERKDGIETRHRILDAACIVFSEKGFRAATVASICKLAGTNSASVNYHFRDKEKLYAEAWKQAFIKSMGSHPPEGGVPPDAPATERFRGRILSLLKRFSDPESHEFEIVHKELANSTGLLLEVMEKSIEPLRQGFCTIIRELLGEETPEQYVQLCLMSIRAQCFSPTIHRRRNPDHKALPFMNTLPPGENPHELDIEIIADHITRFSLAGIEEIRRQFESTAIHGAEQS